MGLRPAAPRTAGVEEPRLRPKPAGVRPGRVGRRRRPSVHSTQPGNRYTTQRSAAADGSASGCRPAPRCCTSRTRSTSSPRRPTSIAASPTIRKDARIGLSASSSLADTESRNLYLKVGKNFGADGAQRITFSASSFLNESKGNYHWVEGSRVLGIPDTAAPGPPLGTGGVPLVGTEFNDFEQYVCGTRMTRSSAAVSPRMPTWPTRRCASRRTTAPIARIR